MINDKQFILGQKSFQSLGWKNLQLSNGFVLSYQEKLKVWTNDPRNIVLLGNMWQVDPNRESPQEELKKLVMTGKTTHEDVFEVEKTWCGRYLLIVDDWIYLDTIGSLGVFYSDEHVSSSLNVLCEAENREMVFPDIVHGRNPDFVPGMRTCYDGVKRLLPSQIYNFVTHEVKSRPLLPDGVVAADSYEERIDLLEKYFIHSLQNMEACFRGQSLCLALTGGRDNRAAMAMLEKSGVEYRTFTCWHEHIKKADVSIPVMLAKKLKKEHLFVPRDENKYSQQRYDDYRIHTAGMAVDEDWKFYLYFQYDDVRGENGETGLDVVILRSGIWENTSEFYSSFLKMVFLISKKHILI